MKTLCTAITIAVLALTTAHAGEATFSKKPRAVKEGDQVKITFGVKASTDVEVAILDGKGVVVRHLAAGLLGEKAPAPLKKGSLAQSLAWDGKDDYGKKLPGGEYEVRVSLGLKPTFDRMLGYDPHTLDVLRGLATGPDGELFVLNLGRHLHAGFGSTVCNVIDREAKYKRTIMPYRAECFPEKVKTFGVLDPGEKGVYPWIHANHLKTIYPFSGPTLQQRPVVLPDGRFVLTVPVRGKGTTLVAVSAKDGSVPKGGAFGPSLGAGVSGYACLAVAPDGETLYVSGLIATRGKKWKHAVYRAKWGEKSVAPFIGKPEEAGAGKTGLNSPQGVATDKDGNVYVADRGNKRVAVFGPDGKFLSELPVEDPYMLEVHRKSGAVYVLGKGDPPEHIVKFKSRKDPQPVYSQKIPHIMRAVKGKKRVDTYPVFALDDSKEDSVLWVGSTTPWERFSLYRFAETGGKLGAPEEKGKAPGLKDCREVQVDRKREEIYYHRGGGAANRGGSFIKASGQDGKVLKSLRVKSVGSYFTLGHDGHVYVVHGIPKTINRYDRDLKPAPFPGRDTNVSDKNPIGHHYSNHIMGRGLAVRRDGTMFLLHENVPQVHRRYGISVWGPDGKVRKQDLVGSLSASARSLRIDPAGNLYVADPVKPAGQLVPPDFKGKVDTAKKKPLDNHYPIMCGSILKFGPKGGGGVGPGVKGRKGVLAYDVQVGIKDALWLYHGVGPVPASHGPYNHYVSACACDGMRFDVDGWGRTFAPDAARFRVVVLDSAGNEIGVFGSYGNQDSEGAGSAVPEPAIPFAWPMAVGVSDRAAYVSDSLNRRMVKVKLAYTQAETCKVKAP